MSLDRKSIHTKISPDLHKQLSVMAEFENKPMAELAALMLEKMIVAEFHDYRIAFERMKKAGMMGKVGD